MNEAKSDEAGAAYKVRWEDLPADHPMAKITRRRVIGVKMMVSHLLLERGFSVGVHAHENEQISLVLSGAFRFRIGAGGEREIIVRAGEAVVLPSNTPHGGEALEDCVILDLFSPPSESTGVDANR